MGFPSVIVWSVNTTGVVYPSRFASRGASHASPISPISPEGILWGCVTSEHTIDIMPECNTTYAVQPANKHSFRLLISRYDEVSSTQHGKRHTATTKRKEAKMTSGIHHSFLLAQRHKACQSFFLDDLYFVRYVLQVLARQCIAVNLSVVIRLIKTSSFGASNNYSKESNAGFMQPITQCTRR